MCRRLRGAACGICLLASGVEAGEFRYPGRGGELQLRVVPYFKSEIARDTAVGTHYFRATSNPGYYVDSLNCDIQRKVVVNGTPLPGQAHCLQPPFRVSPRTTP